MSQEPDAARLRARLAEDYPLPDDRAALITRLADLVDNLTDPEAVDTASLLDAIARSHRLAWNGCVYARRGQP